MGIRGHLCEETWVKHTWKFIFDLGMEMEDNLADFEFIREQYSTLATNFAATYTSGRITKTD